MRARLLHRLAPRRRSASTPTPSSWRAGRSGAALAFGHLAARPWRIPADEAAGAMHNLARSPGFDATLRRSATTPSAATRPTAR